MKEEEEEDLIKQEEEMSIRRKEFKERMEKARLKTEFEEKKKHSMTLKRTLSRKKTLAKKSSD